MFEKTVTLILAGGKGKRLEPLTRDRAKPAVPFGGLYRIIDFPLSNCLHSGLRKIIVLTQYKASSLTRHLAMGWNMLSYELGEFVEVLSPQQRLGDHWYEGTANAIYQNIYSIERANPSHLLILAGDHIYKMDYREMIRFHLENRADLTVGCIARPVEESIHFGVVEANKDNQITSFTEKPHRPKPLPEDPRYFLASMGIYVFTAPLMYEILCQDAADQTSSHDFGTDLIPKMLDRFRVMSFRYGGSTPGKSPYWRDVGTVDAYYQASLDLFRPDSGLDLGETAWPIRSYQPQLPPTMFLQGAHDRSINERAGVRQSIICQGCRIAGDVVNSILSPGIRVGKNAEVINSVLFDGVQVGNGARIRNSIIDKYVQIPEHSTIGFDRNEDAQRGFHITEKGVVVIPKAEPPDTFV